MRDDQAARQAQVSYPLSLKTQAFDIQAASLRDRDHSQIGRGEHNFVTTYLIHDNSNNPFRHFRVVPRRFMVKMLMCKGSGSARSKGQADQTSTPPTITAA